MNTDKTLSHESSILELWPAKIYQKSDAYAACLKIIHQLSFVHRVQIIDGLAFNYDFSLYNQVRLILSHNHPFINHMENLLNFNGEAHFRH